MKFYLTIILLFLFFPGSSQQKEIPIYSGIAPGSETWNWTEGKTDKSNPMKLAFTYNVTKPTLIPFYPDPGKANGSAVIICMGGGLTLLPIDTAGTRVAKALIAKGITAFILKYRLAHSITNNPFEEWQKLYRENMELQQQMIAPIRRLAQDDLENAIIYLKKNAVELDIDSGRLGVIGISAGGKLTANLAYNYNEQTRPAFLGFMSIGLENINRTPLKNDTPPVFIAAASDDEADIISGSFEYYKEWIRSNHKAELHIYAQGTHFLRGFPTQDWVVRLAEWLEGMGFCTPDK